MEFDVGDLVSVNANGNVYEVLEINRLNGYPLKVVSISITGIGTIKGQVQTDTSNSWRGLQWTIVEKAGPPIEGPYKHVIRKIRQLDKRFENRKGYVA